MDDNPENVHRYFNKDGNECWGIGIRLPPSRQYFAPRDAESQKRTGQHTQFEDCPIGCYRTMAAAKREARRLWGYAIVHQLLTWARIDCPKEKGE